MSEQDLIEPIPTAAPPQMGMARFFTHENLDRYRMLTGKFTDADQRRQILLDLSGEMNAFRAEAGKRGTSAPPGFSAAEFGTGAGLSLNDDNICPSI